MGQPQKAFEAQAVGDLKLELQVANLVKALDDERLEHQPRGKRWSSAQTLRLPFGKTRKQRFKEASVDDLFETRQRVTYLMQLLQSRLFIKETTLVRFNKLGNGYAP